MTLHIKTPFFFRITQGVENKNNFSGLSGLGVSKEAEYIPMSLS